LWKYRPFIHQNEVSLLTILTWINERKIQKGSQDQNWNKPLPEPVMRHTPMMGDWVPGKYLKEPVKQNRFQFYG